jgi:hypothetical protein
MPGWTRFEDLFTEVRHGLRQLRGSPAFCSGRHSNPSTRYRSEYGNLHFDPRGDAQIIASGESRPAL